MKTYLPIAVGVVLIAITTGYQGMWSERWSHFPELKLFADRLDAVPKDVGDWKSKDLPKMDENIRQVAGAEGSLSRSYQRGRDSVSIFLVCGRLRDVFYHTPDRCYPAQGFEMLGDPQLQPILLEGPGSADAGKAEFFTTIFEKSGVDGVQRQRIYWSWCATGPWEAPTDPKWTFAGQRALYKLYVVTNVTADQTADQNAATDFIRVFIPQLQKAFEPATDAMQRAVKKAA